MKVLAEIAKNPARGVLVVAHDPRIIPFANRIIHIEDGRIVGVEPGGAAQTQNSEAACGTLVGIGREAESGPRSWRWRRRSGSPIAAQMRRRKGRRPRKNRRTTKGSQADRPSRRAFVGRRSNRRGGGGTDRRRSRSTPTTRYFAGRAAQMLEERRRPWARMRPRRSADRAASRRNDHHHVEPCRRAAPGRGLGRRRRARCSTPGGGRNGGVASAKRRHGSDTDLRRGAAAMFARPPGYNSAESELRTWRTTRTRRCGTSTKTSSMSHAPSLVAQAGVEN